MTDAKRQDAKQTVKKTQGNTRIIKIKVYLCRVNINYFHKTNDNP